MFTMHPADDADPSVVRVVRRVLSPPDSHGLRRLLASEGDQMPVRVALAAGIPEDALEPVEWTRTGGRTAKDSKSESLTTATPATPPAAPAAPKDSKTESLALARPVVLADVVLEVTGVGKSTAKRIASALVLEDFDELSVDALLETLTSIKGVGETTALAVIGAVEAALTTEG